jgi:hypothetical protein
MASFLRDPKVLEYDILAIQEPWRNQHMATTHNPVAQKYHLLFQKDTLEQPARTCFFVNKRLDNTKWRFTDHSRDMGSLTIQTSNKAGEAKEITIYNVYNPLTTKYEESTLPILNEALHNRTDEKIILGL